MMPLGFFCSLAAGQERQPDTSANFTTPSRPKLQTQPHTPHKSQPRQQASVTPTRKTIPTASSASDILPTACPTPVYAVPPGDIYGAFVPYAAPAQPIGCGTVTAPAASTNSSPANSSVVQKPPAASLVDSSSPPALRLA